MLNQKSRAVTFLFADLYLRRNARSRSDRREVVLHPSKKRPILIQLLGPRKGGMAMPRVKTSNTIMVVSNLFLETPYYGGHFFPTGSIIQLGNLIKIPPDRYHVFAP